MPCGLSRLKKDMHMDQDVLMCMQRSLLALISRGQCSHARAPDYSLRCISGQVLVGFCLLLDVRVGMQTYG